LKERSGVQGNGARHTVEIFLISRGSKVTSFACPSWLASDWPKLVSATRLRDANSRLLWLVSFCCTRSSRVQRRLVIFVFCIDYGPFPTASQLPNAVLSHTANRRGDVNSRASVLRRNCISVHESRIHYFVHYSGRIATRFPFLYHSHAQQYPRQVTPLANVPQPSRLIFFKRAFHSQRIEISWTS
jgi:hypothetical protein